MSDTTITSDVSTESGSAVTATPEQFTGTENAPSENNQTNAGGEQSTAEGGQSQTEGRRSSSLYKDVTKLRAQNRELREQFGQVEQLRQDLSMLREELARRNQPGTAKTPANFWQDPEGTIDSKLGERLERLESNMIQRFEMTREQEFQQQALRQEQSSAVEFIRSQQGYDSADDEDLIEIIDALPNKQHLSPQMVAEYAWMKLNQSRGVGDRSHQKRQAASVQGQPPGTSFGRKNWSKTEFDQALDMIEKDRQNPKYTELLKELEAAHKEGRVR